MLKIILLSYLAIGISVVFFTKARQVINKSLSEYRDVDSSYWKIPIFIVIINSIAVLIWPIFSPSLFSKQKTVWDKLNDDPSFKLQKALLEATKLMSEEDGVDADELPNGQGEFGLVPTNPIPCKTIHGCEAYLRSLRTLDGEEILYERSGSTISNISPNPVDIYEVSNKNGRKLAALYISPYHKRISNKAPCLL